jgi:hypothetical protein
MKGSAAKALEEERQESATVDVGKLAKKNRVALKALRELESDGEASILFFEAAEAAAAGGRHNRGLRIENYPKEIFPSKPLTYPLLFSQDEKLEMNRSDLMTEIAVIMAMAKPDIATGPHIYSIQVLEPKDLSGFVKPEKLGDYFGGNVPPDIKSGYVYGPVLYGAPQFVRSIVLEGVLGNAKEVEIALRNPSTSNLERKKVTLG